MISSGAEFKMGKDYLLTRNRVGPEFFSLFCHTELAFILDATELLWSVHLRPLLRSFSGLSHCSKTSDCFESQHPNFAAYARKERNGQTMLLLVYRGFALLGQLPHCINKVQVPSVLSAFNRERLGSPTSQRYLICAIALLLL